MQNAVGKQLASLAFMIFSLRRQSPLLVKHGMKATNVCHFHFSICQKQTMTMDHNKRQMNPTNRRTDGYDLHSLFFIRTSFFFRRLNVLIFKAKWSLQCSYSVLNFQYYINYRKPYNILLFNYTKYVSIEYC